MLVVALLLLPAMGLLLIGMDRVEDRLRGNASPPSGRHRRHLRLVSGHARGGHRPTVVGERRDEAA